MSLSASAFIRVWLYALIAIPLLPRVKVAGTDGVPILLDDLVLAACIGLAIVGIFSRASVQGFLKIPYTTISTLFLCLLAYKAVAFLSLAFFLPWISVSAEKGVIFIEGILVLTKLCFFFFAYSLVLVSLPERRDSFKAIRVMVLCMALVVCYGLFQFFVLDHTTLTSTFRNIYQMSLTVPGIWEFADPWFGDATVGHEHFGAFLILTFSLVAGFLLCGYPNGRYKRYMLGLLWICCIFCLVYASSRGAWIGAVCSLAMFFLWHLQQGKIVQLCSYSLFVVFGVMILVHALDLDPLQLISQRVEGLLTVDVDEITDVSAIDRFELLQLLWDRYLERPLIGWGAGGAGRIAEGQYIRELVEGGIIGGTLFMALVFSCVRVAQKHYQRSEDPLVMGSNLGLVCGIAGIAGQAMFTELFILTKIGVPFWILVAIVQSLGFQEDRVAQ
jgi:hypothetical protein